MQELFLICKEGKNIFRSDSTDSTLWESGYWALDAARLQNLVGSRISIHENCKALSYHGGTILAIKPSEAMPGRSIIQYQIDNKTKTTAPPKIWGRHVRYE